MLSLVVWINKYGGDFMPDYSTIYILYSCNEWKGYSSMRFIAASTDIEDIYKVVKSEIRCGDVDYNGLTKRRGAKLFKEEWQSNCTNPAMLLNMLAYGIAIYENNIAFQKKMKG